MAVVCADRNDGRLTAQRRVALYDPVGAIYPNEERERAQSLFVGRLSPCKAQPWFTRCPVTSGVNLEKCC
jgi:hypothetical protein